MIEAFNSKYNDFFDESSHMKRWKNLIKVYEEDYDSFRVLFLVEIAGLFDRWEEPSAESLNKILKHIISGGRLGIKTQDIIDLIQAVWPLEMAKMDVLLLRTFVENFKRKDYFFTHLKIQTTALVQTWWAFETLMNDLAGIIAEQRKDLLEPFEMLLLQEKAVALDKRGKIEKKKKYQPIDTRIQFIYKMLTNESIDRSSSEWHNIMHLKNARDSYIHRVGKDDSKKYSFFDEKIVFKGFKSIQRIIAHVFKKTPEFSEIFAYKFLAFWSCQNDLPFFGDGMGGDSFYLGLVEIKPQALIDLYAPMPSSFSLFT